jgi:hypothetical protein
MPSAPNNLNDDALPRVWDAVKLEPLEERLQAAGITKLPDSPDAPEMEDIRTALSTADPELLALLSACISKSLSSDAVTKLAGPAERAAKSQALKGVPKAMMSSLNHKNRSQVDKNKFLIIGGTVTAVLVIGFIFYSPSSAQTTGTAVTGQAGSGSAAGTAPGSAIPGGTAVAGTAQPAASTGTAVTPASTDPAGTPLSYGGTALPPAPVTTSLPAVSPSAEVATPQVAAAPAPSPYVPQQVTSVAPAPYIPQQVAPTPARGGSQAVNTPSGRTGAVPAVPARVPLMALQVPPRIAEAPRRVVAMSAPLQRTNRVVQSSPAEQQGATVSPARSGVMASSAPAVAPSRLMSSAAQADVPATGRLVSQGQASAPQAAPAQGLSQQSVSPSGRSGLVAMGTGSAGETPVQDSGLVSAAGGTREAPAQSAGLVSAAGGSGGGTALQGAAADSGRGGLVSAASSSRSGGLSQDQGTADAAPSAAPQATVLGGAAPVPAVPDSPYVMGKQIKAVTDTGALFASVVGDSGNGAGVINGEDAQLVYATAEDGSVWRGAPRLLTSGRIGLTFDRVLVKGQAMKVLADATDSTGLPGVQAESHTDSPKIASELFQSLLSGARSFAQASLQGDTSITANGTIVSASAKPNFWVTLGGALAGSLSLPSARVTQVNVTSLPKGTQIMLVVRGE